MIASEPSTSDPYALTRKHVVLLVDDEPEVLSSLRRLLRREPYEVLATEDPAEALARVRDGDVSLVISDQRMPAMPGTQLLDEVARTSPATARVILTGYPGSTVIVKGLNQGIQKLLYKPWNGEALKRTIRELLHEYELRVVREHREGQG